MYKVLIQDDHGRTITGVRTSTLRQASIAYYQMLRDLRYGEWIPRIFRKSSSLMVWTEVFPITEEELNDERQ